MFPFKKLALRIAFVMLAAAAMSRPATAPRISVFTDFPRVTVWAWERPEDLRSLDPRKFAVAYLDREIRIDTAAHIALRRQPLRVAENAKVTAVVRISVAPASPLLEDPATRVRIVDHLVAAAAHDGVSALQIDFDALRSQRGFYRALLKDLRPRLPQGMPLSITALASWCGYDNWIAGLPIDEAVPMYFRMEPVRSAPSPGWTPRPFESKCRTSAGVSTDEPWPTLDPALRVYVFHPRSWSEPALAALQRKLNP